MNTNSPKNSLRNGLSNDLCVFVTHIDIETPVPLDICTHLVVHTFDAIWMDSKCAMDSPRQEYEQKNCARLKCVKPNRHNLICIIWVVGIKSPHGFVDTSISLVSQWLCIFETKMTFFSSIPLFHPSTWILHGNKNKKEGPFLALFSCYTCDNC